MSKYKFKTTNIRGKQYVEVNERIKFFRQEDEYKNWTISTWFDADISENNNTVFFQHALTDYSGKGHVLFDSDPPNKVALWTGSFTYSDTDYEVSSLSPGWHHLMVSSTDTSTIIYVDHVESDEQE